MNDPDATRHIETLGEFHNRYDAIVRLRPEHPLTDAALTARATYGKNVMQPPLTFLMHTATLGALLAEGSVLEPESSLGGNYILGLLCARDDDMALGMIRAAR